MNRDHLIDAIYNDPNRWSCIDYNCDETDDGNAEDCCRRCAEKQLSEYEKKIRNDAIDECHKLICDYLYSNNIRLIKIKADETYMPIYPYKFADDIEEQMKEGK